ncbi:hypothetical protein BJ964_003913 [Actinoplanes lobatus]|uniref:Uncharacterized protein n=1 Tax=Actinoplanes lobatus TaxID=113568 RepID=A0A7W7HGP6_9ACTN|nr:hypothetical protein [Actinoplanes lobatus]
MSEITMMKRGKLWDTEPDRGCIPTLNQNGTAPVSRRKIKSVCQYVIGLPW